MRRVVFFAPYGFAPDCPVWSGPKSCYFTSALHSLQIVFRTFKLHYSLKGTSNFFPPFFRRIRGSMVLLCRLSGLLVRSRASLQGTYNLGSIRALRTRSGKLPVSLVRAATSPTPAEADAAPAPAAPAPSPVEISSAPVEDTPPAPTFESLGLNSFIVVRRVSHNSIPSTLQNSHNVPHSSLAHPQP